MALTKETKQNALKVLLGQVNEDNQSSVLPIPVERSNKQIDFQGALNVSGQGITITNIVKIVNFENRNIVFINGTNAQNQEVGAIIVYDSYFRWIQNLFKHYTNVDTGESFNKWYAVKVNGKNGCVYGLNLVNGKVSFFELNSFFTKLGLISEDELTSELFYTKTFDIETEITQDSKGAALDVKIGNALFSQLRTTGTKYGFIVDTLDDNIYSFIILDKVKNEVSFIRFNADLGTKFSNDSTISWEYNEVISLTTGDGLANETFEDISVLDIFTGERNISQTETSIGSIALSTQKGSTGTVLVPHNANFSSSLTNGEAPLYNISEYDASKRGPWLDAPSNTANKTWDVLWPSELTHGGDGDEISTIFLSNANAQSILDKIRTLIASGALDTSTTYNVEVASLYGNNEKINFSIDNTVATKMINANKVEWKLENINVRVQFIQTTSADITFQYTLSGDINLYLNDIKDSMLTTFSKQIASNRQSNKYDFDALKTSLNQANNPHLFFKLRNWNVSKSRDLPWSYVYISNIYGEIDYSAQITINTQFNFKREQETLGANTTSQILIDKVENSDKLVYKIVQKANNSYDGNEPVFISPSKFYIPLKTADTGTYSIFEFDGDSSRTSTVNTQYYNGIGKVNYSDIDTDIFTVPLLNAISITSVKSNLRGTLTSDKYTLVNQTTLTVKNVTTNEQIEVTYTTKIGQPKKVVVDQSTTGEDIFIYGIDDYKELGTTSRAIVGVGDDSLSKTSTPNHTFGFNLYKTQEGVDYNAISEVMIDKGIKIKHVFGYRKKNMLIWYGFNENYSNYVSFLQIYPDSFSPYTYAPYSNPTRYFYPERLNINYGSYKPDTVFDREFLDVAQSGSTVIASTEVSTYDANLVKNDTFDVFGATGAQLFTFEKELNKSEQENVIVNLQLDVSVIDNIQGKQLALTEVEQTLTNMFAVVNNTSYKELAIDKGIVTYTDNSKVEFNAREYLKLDEQNDLIRFGATLFKLSGKTLKTLEITLKNGKTLTTYDFTQAQQCSGRKIDLTFEIKFKDKNDQLPYLRFNDTPWNRPYEPQGGN